MKFDTALKRTALSALLCLTSMSALAQDQSGDPEGSTAEREVIHQARRAGPTWRYEIANDVVFDTDNQFTNGWSVQKHSAAADSLDEVEGVLGFGRRLANRLLPEGDGLYYRGAFRLGQNMVTPDDLENPNIILDDVPYHGMLGIEGSWIAFNDKRFNGFALTAGLVGKASLAEITQKAWHELINTTYPEGWEHQLDHEPVLQVAYMVKRKLWNTPSFDGAVNFDASLGNYNTGVNLGLEMQFGRKPIGFTYVPDPVGKNMAYDATLGRADGRAEIYGTLAARVWAWAVFMPLEGNTFRNGNEWTENNTIDPKHVVGQAVVGFHIVKPRWGLHFSFTFQTDNVDPDSVGVPVENNFGIITYDYRFR